MCLYELVILLLQLLIESFCIEYVECMECVVVFFFQAEDGIRDLLRSRGLGDVYKRQVHGVPVEEVAFIAADREGDLVRPDGRRAPRGGQGQLQGGPHLSLIHI